MADNLQIPKYKEKVVVWDTDGGTRVSFPVSASYRGILRLSPNDDASLVERQSLDLYEGSATTFYRDSIDPAITQQFIRISTSDGYFVGLRLNQYEIEGDNIYVIGKAQHDTVRLYTRRDNSFKIKANTSLPVRVNTDPSALIPGQDLISQDITDIDVHNATDRSCIAVSRNLQERVFGYEQTAQLVKELVKEALLDLQSLPPGSIHFTPMTIHEYAKLLMEGYPNSYFLKDGETPNDPIARDFLICDGSLYRNQDYPELAKILEGERIDYWRYDVAKDRMVQTTYYNDYTENKWFRVPDLRARFIKSVMCGRQYVDMEGNETGSYTNDACPATNDDSTQTHTHFITTAFYQNEPEIENYAKVVNVDSETGEITGIGKQPGVFHPHNENQLKLRIRYGGQGVLYKDKAGNGCSFQTCSFHGSAYFASIPQDYNVKNRQITPTIGLTSIEIPSCEPNPSSDDIIDYNGRTDYVPFIGTPAASAYAMENAPENYCALPMIKI